MARLGRRKALTAIAALPGAWAALGSRRGFADIPVGPSPPDLEVRDYTVAGDRALSNRFVLCVPTHLTVGETVPLLVALHGLGETVDPRTGAYAFVERYGLPQAYQRLRRPPITRTIKNLDYFGDAGLDALNASLANQPFRGIAIACPYMPNFNQLERDPTAFDRYASWIIDTVIPTARREAPVQTDAAHTSLDGVSLGGYVGLEVFLRRPEVFGAWGSVQGAFGLAKVPGYADKLAAVIAKGRKDLHLETSTGDPFHEPTVSLADLLTKRGIPRELLVYPGPHDQVWLRESGTMGMLRWHDARER
jgi:hypothetical protein